MPSEKTETKAKPAGSDGYSMNDTIRRLYADDLEENKKNPFTGLKRPLLVALTSVLAIVMLLGYFVYSYNSFVKLEENVFSTRGHIQAELQRRHNLFNNLVNLVLDYAAFEREVFEQVTKMRNSLKDAEAVIGRTEGGGGAAKETAIDSQAVSGLQKTMSQLMAVVEKYPDLKASEVYRTLMEKLVETENRIALRRAECNENVRIYNNKIARIPWVWVAMLFGYHEMDYFKIEEGIEDQINPVVQPNMFKKLVPER